MLQIYNVKVQNQDFHVCLKRYPSLPPANEVWGKVIFFAPVCHSVHRGGEVSGQEPPSRYTPLGRYTPWTGTPPGRYTPPAGTPPGRYTPPQACTPLPPGRYTPWTGTPPPPPMHAGIRSTSGRYASYWNAFLFLDVIFLTKLNDLFDAYVVAFRYWS